MTDKPELDLTAFDGHTPGPWSEYEGFVTGDERVNGTLDPECGPVLSSEYITLIAKSAFCVNPRWTQDRELILAAPDLLAEVKRLRAEVEALRERVCLLQRSPFSSVPSETRQSIMQAIDAAKRRAAEQVVIAVVRKAEQD